MNEPPTTSHQAALDEIIALATDLARRIHAAATTEPATLSLEQASIALDRTARTLRRSILLARHLQTPPPWPKDRATTRLALIRGVENAIHATARTRPIDTQGTTRELLERLETPAMELDLQTRPVADIIRELCEDLGVPQSTRTYTFPRRRPADIERLQTQATSPSPPGRGSG